MELEGTVRMRYDPERRAAVMAWLAQQGVDVSRIPRLAKHSPTPQASEGEAFHRVSCSSHHLLVTWRQRGSCEP